MFKCNLGNLDAYKWSDRFYRAAENIAMDEKLGINIFKHLEHIWPAGLKGQNVHYNGRPFDQVNMIQNEDTADCVLAPPLRNFKFDFLKCFAQPVEEDRDDHQDTPQSSRKRRSRAPPSDDEEDNEYAFDQDFPRPFFDQFKRQK